MSSSRRRPKKPISEPLAPASPERDDLAAASRAQVGRDEEARPYRPRSDDASIEDPLEETPPVSGIDAGQ